jgi:hypothetical protein
VASCPVTSIAIIWIPAGWYHLCLLAIIYSIYRRSSVGLPSVALSSFCTIAICIGNCGFGTIGVS